MRRSLLRAMSLFSLSVSLVSLSVRLSVHLSLLLSLSHSLSLFSFSLSFSLALSYLSCLLTCFTGVHRAAVIDEQNRVINVVSQSDVIRFLHKNLSYYGTKVNNTIEEIGLGKRRYYV